MNNKFFKLGLYFGLFIIISMIIIFTKLNNLFILPFFLLLMFIYIFTNNKKMKRKIMPIEEKREIVINTELPIDFDIQGFKCAAEDLYKKMQLYFSDIDYENLKNILCDNIYNQFKSQMEHLEKTNKRSIKENIEIIDFKINKYDEDEKERIIVISMGVYEDKYTKYLDNPQDVKKLCYEDYYEIKYILGDTIKIENLTLLNSRTKKN